MPSQGTHDAADGPSHDRTAAHLPEIIDIVLEYPQVADPQFRQLIVSMLPRSLGERIRRLAAPRPDVASIVHTCSRNADDLWSLVSVLRVLSVIPTVTTALEAAVVKAVGPPRP